MAKVGDIIQYQGPFDTTPISITPPCVLGISVSEKDFMQAGSSTEDSSIQVKINNQPQTIFIGRTFIYQTQEQYNITSVQFPNGAPASTLVNIIYCPARSD